MTTGLLLHHGVRWHGHTPWIIAGIAHWFVVQCHVDAKWSARHWKCLACCGWGACCCCIPRSRPSHNLLLRSSHHDLHNLSHNLRNHNHLRFERRKSWGLWFCYNQTKLAYANGTLKSWSRVPNPFLFLRCHIHIPRSHSHRSLFHPQPMTESTPEKQKKRCLLTVPGQNYVFFVVNYICVCDYIYR